MALIIAIGVLLIVAGGLFAAGSYYTHLNRRDDRRRDELEAAKAAARWEVGVNSCGAGTGVFVQRRARTPSGAVHPHGDLVAVAIVSSSNPNYDALMDKATTDARARARAFNATLEPDYVSQEPS